jgi:hypothetical protein
MRKEAEAMLGIDRSSAEGEHAYVTVF